MAVSVKNNINKAKPATRAVNSSKKALHRCLKRIKQADNETDLCRLTEELQRIVFHKQWQNVVN
jgi:hypothetical protein